MKLESNGGSCFGVLDIETGVFTKWADCAFHTNHDHRARHDGYSTRVRRASH